jgi:hypothetical protein
VNSASVRDLPSSHQHTDRLIHTLKTRFPTELTAKVRVEPTREVCRRNELKWLGHDWVKSCTRMEVEGRASVA